MSSIVDKAFNAAQKILRTVFRGSPNLFTTPDLNRQFEAIRYNLDSLEIRLGVLSDLTFSGSLVGSTTLSLSGSLTYLIAKGCDFSTDLAGTVSVSKVISPSATGPFYVCLIGQATLVTYSDDPSHDISGAKFADGSSQAAADNYVVSNPSIVISDTLSVDNLIGILAFVTISDGQVTIRNGCIPRGSNVAARKEVIDRLSPYTVGGPIYSGQELNPAILTLDSIFLGRGLSHGSSMILGQLGSISSYFSLANGVGHFAIMSGQYSFTGPSSSIGVPAYLAEIPLPDSVSGVSIKSYFNKLLSHQTYTTLSDGSGEGRTMGLCLLETIAEGSFYAEYGSAGSPVIIIGHAKLILGARVLRSNGEVQNLGLFLMAERAGSMVREGATVPLLTTNTHLENTTADVVETVSLVTPEDAPQYLNVNYEAVIKTSSLSQSHVNRTAPYVPSEVSGVSFLRNDYYTTYDLKDATVRIYQREISIPMLWPLDTQ